MSSKTIALFEFLNLVKVMRMLYGVEVAKRYFEKNLFEFTGHTLSELEKLKRDARIEVTHEP